jgi:hypothetical protein
MKNYYSNKSQGINDAKQLLRARFQTKRLSNLEIKSTSVYCGCGETSAYRVSSYGANGYGKEESVLVCLCKYCR